MLQGELSVSVAQGLLIVRLSAAKASYSKIKEAQS